MPFCQAVWPNVPSIGKGTTSRRNETRGPCMTWEGCDGRLVSAPVSPRAPSTLSGCRWPPSAASSVACVCRWPRLRCRLLETWVSDDASSSAPDSASLRQLSAQTSATASSTAHSTHQCRHQRCNVPSLTHLHQEITSPGRDFFLVEVSGFSSFQCSYGQIYLLTSGYVMVVHGRPQTPKNTSFLGSPSPQGSHSPYILGDTTRPRHITHFLVWSKSDQRRLRKTLHKQTDKQTDTTKIMVTWPWTNKTCLY